MCYAKPGPRCSTHVKKEITTLQKEIAAEYRSEKPRKQKIVELNNRLKKAEKDYLITPAGIAELKKRYDTISGHGKKNTVASTRALTEWRRAKNERKTQMITYETEQKVREAEKLAEKQIEWSLSRNQSQKACPEMVSQYDLVGNLPDAAARILYNIDYDFEDYKYDEPSDGYYYDYYDEPSDYCSGGEIEIVGYVNPTVRGPIDAQKMAQAYIGFNHRATCVEDVADKIVELGLNDVTTYRIDEDDLYGGKPQIVPADIETFNSKLRELEKYVYSLQGADDKNGILKYVRSKGFNTPGLTPTEAVKQQLREENNNRRHKLVDNATDVQVKKIPLKNIHAPAEHHKNKVESRPVKANGNSPAIAGVVHHNPYSNKYVLVDGYHRAKHLEEQGRKIGTYIVLSSN